MTEKELHKLKRHDLLQIMLTQSEEVENLSKQLEETESELHQVEEGYERLRKRLDLKDEQIAELRQTLEKERSQRKIELDEAGSIAEAALRLNDVFETAQKAADQYLYNIQHMKESQDADE